MSTTGWPRGSVTFLFTDIEGSTALWERYPEEMTRAYQRHDVILRSATTNHGGVVYKVIGDAFQIAFTCGSAALSAALSAQRELTSEAWPLPHPLRVRMALHSGWVEPGADGDYRSPVLNRLGRLLGAAHGGQVLCSSAVRSSVLSALPADAAFQDLGMHRLRDLHEYESIAQLTGAGLLEQFPPLRTLELRPNNLPTPPTPLIGRKPELKEITSILRSQANRLLTLTGIGGTGKTRLALEVALDALESWADGVYFVDLAPVRDPELVLPAIAETIGVRASGSLSSNQSLTAFLADKSWLILLDNFEQVIGAAPSVAQLAVSCPSLTILVTSRERLHLHGERLYPLAPLAVPGKSASFATDEFARIESIALFVERAQAALPSFALDDENAPDMAELCRRLEGVPLAIELAAARMNALTPEAMLTRISRRLDLLVGGAHDLPARHQTLRAAIAWSHQLLNRRERKLARSLATFESGFTVEAAEHVCRVSGSELALLNGLTSLVDKNLLRRIDAVAGESRYAMFETIREFELAQLRSADEEVLRERHAEWYCTLIERSNEQPQVERLNQIDREYGNLRSALEWASDANRSSLNLRLAGALSEFWNVRGYVTEGRSFLDAALLADSGAPSHERLQVIVAAGKLAYVHGDNDSALAWFEAGLETAKLLGDEPEIAEILNNIAGLVIQNDVDKAEELFAESLDIARRLGDQPLIAAALGNLGAVAHYRGDYDVAISRYQEALNARRLQRDAPGIATMLINLLLVLAPFPERHVEARSFGQEGLQHSEELGDLQGQAYALGGLGLVAEMQRDYVIAAAYYERSLALFRAKEDRSGVARALGNLGSVALELNDPGRAATLCRESLQVYVELGDSDSIAYLLECLARIAVSVNVTVVAAKLYGAAEALREQIRLPIPMESRERYELTVASIRDKMGEHLIAQQWTLGRQMPVEAAAKEALSFAMPADAGDH